MEESKKKGAEKLLAEKSAQTHELAAATAEKTIVQLKEVNAKLKAERLAANPGYVIPPIEQSQDRIITAMDGRQEELQAEASDYKRALKLCDEKTSLVEQALQKEEARAGAFAKALSVIPKEKPRSVTLFGGIDSQGKTQYALEVSRSWGRFGLSGLVTTQKSVYAGAKYTW